MCGANRHVRFTSNSDRESRHPQTVMSALPPKADMCSALAHVCFGPRADSCNAAKRSLFDDLVGSGEQSRRDNKPERFGRLQVDDELKLGRAQDRQVGRSLALKNAPAIDPDLANEVRKVRSVAHQSPSFDALTIGVERWQPMVRRQRDEVLATAVEERIVIDQQCVKYQSRDWCLR